MYLYVYMSVSVSTFVSIISVTTPEVLNLHLLGCGQTGQLYICYCFSLLK